MTELAKAIRDLEKVGRPIGGKINGKDRMYSAGEAEKINRAMGVIAKSFNLDVPENGFLSKPEGKRGYVLGADGKTSMESIQGRLKDQKGKAISKDGIAYHETLGALKRHAGVDGKKLSSSAKGDIDKGPIITSREVAEAEPPSETRGTKFGPAAGEGAKAATAKPATSQPVEAAPANKGRVVEDIDKGPTIVSREVAEAPPARATKFGPAV